ncbi:hypothetical protein FJY90_05790 [Candidatus Gottesmanbacteria bacterium]|nr:hypothetical protein [Candidatus Gottesmanbacteria bacterium]
MNAPKSSAGRIMVDTYFEYNGHVYQAVSVRGGRVRGQLVCRHPDAPFYVTVPLTHVTRLSAKEAKKFRCQE